MRAFLAVLAAIMLMAAAVGCAMSQNTFDDTYDAYGGSQARTDRNYGRVGSRFQPAGGAVETAPEPGEELPVPDEAAPDLAPPVN